MAVLLWVNRTIGVALILAAILLWEQSGRFPEAARLFPRILLAAIVFLSVVMIARSFVPAITPPRDGEGERYPQSLVRPMATFAVVAVAIAALRSVGFFPAMLGMAALLYPLLQVRNWKLYLAACCIVLIFVYAVFVLILGVPLTSVRLLGP